MMHQIMTNARTSDEIYRALERHECDGVGLFCLVEPYEISIGATRLCLCVVFEAGGANLWDYITALDRASLLD